MTVTQLLNGASGVSSFVLGVCLFVLLWRSRHARLLAASFLPEPKRQTLVNLFACLWGVPVTMILGAFKVWSYALQSTESPLATAMTAVSFAVVSTVAVIAIVDLTKLLTNDK